MCEIYSNLTIKVKGVFIANFERISHIPAFLLLILKRWTFGWNRNIQAPGSIFSFPVWALDT